MKKSKLKQLQTLAEEHKKIKDGILEMCSSLDKTKNIKEKEVIKVAIDKSEAKLTEVEELYQKILDTISLKDGGN